MFFRGHTLLPVVIVLTAAGISGASKSHNPSLHNPQGINLWKLLHLRAAGIATAPKEWYAVPGAPDQASQAPLVAAPPSTEFGFHAETFVQPLDHFDNSTDATFAQRFWVNKRHYRPRPGAPVIVIDGGETSGEDRLPFLDKGIADILARATGGVGVVLEHRYYGASVGSASSWLGVGLRVYAGRMLRFIFKGKSVGVQNFSTDALRCVWFIPDRSCARRSLVRARYATD
jgi:hypothetical protein